MKEIPVKGGLVALVDDGDYEMLGQYKWYMLCKQGGRTIYAQAYVRGSIPQRKVLLHRLIVGAPVGVQVDHKDGDGLNCQRYNLRTATNIQNMHNVRKYRTSKGIPTSSIYKGVRWKRDSKSWEARGCNNGKNVHLGYFKSEAEAAIAYNAFAAEHYGEFARMNDVTAHLKTPIKDTGEGPVAENGQMMLVEVGM